MRVLITGGGTSGHVHPALAIADAVRELEPDVEFLYVGTAEGLEAGIVPGHGLPFRAVASRGLAGGGPLRAAAGLAAALRGLAGARRILEEFRPDVVLGTGGYVSGPVAAAAGLAGVPLVLHEQNVVPGLANRWAARWARVVTVPFAEARRYFGPGVRVAVTGNPVRRDILETGPEEGRRVLGLPPGPKVVYVVGGSRGAAVLNEAAVAALSGWLSTLGAAVVFAAGRRYFDAVRRTLAEKGMLPPTESARPDADRFVLVPYLDRVDAALAAADVIVTRAGGTTLAEVTAKGVPAVVVPSPNVAHNHQERNAEVLARAGAARVILERELSGPLLERTVGELLADADLRRRMREASLALGRPDADRDVARLVIAAARRRLS